MATTRIDPYALVGTTLHDRYTLVSFAGVGRHSIAYRAIDAGTLRPVGVRLLKVRANLAPIQRTALVERLRSLVVPVKAIAEHYPAFAHVMAVSAVTTNDGHWMPVFVQRWLDGHTLESVLVRERQTCDGRRSLSRAIQLLSPIADALHYAHARGVVHGSLAPRNLLLRDRVHAEWTRVEVLDLGIANAVSTMQARDRAFVESPPSPHFFVTSHGAPEQFATTRGVVGPAADVFALALIVVELVTGTPPLGVGNDAQLQRAAGDPLARPTPRAHGVALGPYVEAVLERALAVRPQDRYATIGSFWDALRAASRMVLRPGGGVKRRSVPPPLPAESQARM